MILIFKTPKINSNMNFKNKMNIYKNNKMKLNLRNRVCIFSVKGKLKKQ